MEVTSDITPDECLKLQEPTENFLCNTSSNIYEIKFGRFRLRDINSGMVLFEIEADERGEKKRKQEPIRYNFGPDFLQLRTIGTQLEFSVGEKPVKDFVMIERHYFKGKLLQNYEFKFNFCIPNSTNTWE
jgi:hypothetical protein